jgi:hypothetical protein
VEIAMTGSLAENAATTNICELVLIFNVATSCTGSKQIATSVMIFMAPMACHFVYCMRQNKKIVGAIDRRTMSGHLSGPPTQKSRGWQGVAIRTVDTRAHIMERASVVHDAIRS